MLNGRGLIVIIEDEAHIARLQRLYLDAAGFGVHVEPDGAAGLAAARRLRPTLILLDVGLPGMDGIEVCQALRAENDWTPIIFVTARDEEVDKVLGLELGADDYLAKPFSPRELVARVKSVIRRHQGPGTSSMLTTARLQLDLDRRWVTADHQPVRLTALEFDLLAELLKSPGRVLSREQLLSNVWGQGSYRGGRTVDVHVAQLRSKLGDASPIRTVHGVGYAADA